MKTGAIILCGGESRRMTVPKASLPFGDEAMLQRVVRICDESLAPIVVVAAPDQALPPLPPHVTTVRDRQRGRGPLEGIAAGLRALQDQVDAAYVTSCDVPFLHSGFIRELIAQLNEHDVAVPVDSQFHHPLSAVYRTSVLPAVEELLDSRRMRPVFLFDAVDTVRVPTTELRRVDPDLDALVNMNHPSDYLAAVKRAGVTVPDQLRQQLTDIDSQTS